VRFVGLLVGSVFLLVGCGFAHDAVVTSYHAVTAPVRIFSHPSDNRPTTTVTTTTTSAPPASDVRNPGRPVMQPTPTPTPRKMTARRAPSPSPSPSGRTAAKRPPAATTKPSASAQASGTVSFPTAKPVPNKPGYVFSPSEPAKYVDVSGYAPGSKVKDPYSGKIFLVP
jgi:hypothetical protein